MTMPEKAQPAPPPAAGAPAAAEVVDPLPKEGDVLAGKYRIEKILGQGGMGVVVAAQHTTLRQKVAVKFLLPDAAKREDAAERFLREARAAVSIQSEHVARVMDVGTLETGSPYMVMEFLTGNDLGVLLGERGTFPVAEAVDYVLQACEAIAEAHSIGIIHRDLKPANLFLSQRADGSPLIKVLDFGLSKVTKPDVLDASLTAANVVMGSPCYMSPEQIRSLKGLDARTDIWALGVILYQLLTGVRPFEAPSLGALFFTIGADPPKPLRQRRADIPPGLEAAVLKCLEKDPTQRTQTIAQLARSLAPFGNEDTRLSVERIHRVLSDATTYASMRPPPGTGDTGMPQASALRLAPVVLTGDDDPTLAALESGPHGGVFGSNPSFPYTPVALLAPGVSGQVPEQVKSGSMAAIASPSLVPRTPAASRGHGGLVAAVVVGAVVFVAGVAAVGMRFSGMGDAPRQAATSTTAPEAMGATPTPTEAAPTVAAAPTAAPAPSAVPTADATASADTSAKTAKPPPPRVLHPSPGSKKAKDVLEKWK
jgi:serine/threonine protein kinase